MFKANLINYKKTLPTTDNKTDRALFAKHDNFRFEHSGYYPLLDHGTYYYPAWKHYNRKTSVFCDRCHRQNLRASIGYANFDLCLLCVDELTRLNFDCPSRHCHESKFINDNSVNFTRPEYIDLNRYYYHQHYDINSNNTAKKENIENIDNIDNEKNNDETEHFTMLKLKKNDIFNTKNIAIFIIIAMIIFLFCRRSE
jgi:hypothetical protein